MLYTLCKYLTLGSNKDAHFVRWKECLGFGNGHIPYGIKMVHMFPVKKFISMYNHIHTIFLLVLKLGTDVKK